MRKDERGLAATLIETAGVLKYRVKSLLGKGPKVRMLYLEVTHHCNARCITCYTKAGQEKKDVLTLDEKKSVVRQAKELGARTVSLSGSGEPLLYPHLFDLIGFIRQLDMQVVMFTNGTVLNEETAFALRAESLHSLDAARRTTRDLSRVLASAEQFDGRHFASLARQFCVSIEAMAIRLEELGLV